MKTVLYLGTDPSSFSLQEPFRLIHYPLIHIAARSPFLPEMASVYNNLSSYSHFLFTSKYGVKIFFSHLKTLALSVPTRATYLAIGKKTASFLTKEGIDSCLISQEECQEGVISLLQTLPSSIEHLLLPHSSLARPLLALFLQKEKISHTLLPLYDTQFIQPSPPPSFDAIDLFVFTSPSTVRAFVYFFHKLPSLDRCLSIGPITKNELNKFIYINKTQ